TATRSSSRSPSCSWARSTAARSSERRAWAVAWPLHTVRGTVEHVAGSAEIGVVGAGIVGLSTAYALRERGVRVVLYERGVPGNGQSGGKSRIFRHSHDDPRLVAFARRSHALWREWKQRSGRE